MGKIGVRVDRILSDVVGQMNIHETVSVYDLTAIVNERLRVSSVSTATVSAWCRMNNLERVSVGIWEKVRI